ncbi:hypothetical protein P3S67_030712 [Capsicum chacoense]
MKRSLAKNTHLYWRSLLMPNRCSAAAATSVLPSCRLFTSKSSNQADAGSNDTNDDNLQHEDDISNKALKKKIDRFYEGDDEAFSSIFEAILKRKLAGKSEESDEELMNEIQAQPRQHDVSNGESDSD